MARSALESLGRCPIPGLEGIAARILAHRADATGAAETPDLSRTLARHGAFSRGALACCQQAIAGFAFRRHSVPPTPLELAAAFATATYPQRSLYSQAEKRRSGAPEATTQVDDRPPAMVAPSRRHRRLTAFLEIWDALQRQQTTGPNEFPRLLEALEKADRLPQGIDLPRILTRWEDFVGTVAACRDDDGPRVQAAVFLATCDPEMARRVWQSLERDGDLVRGIREGFSIPPSEVIGWDAGQRLSVPGLSNELDRRFPSGHPSVHKALAQLEVLAQRTFAWRCDAPRVASEVQRFWQKRHENLCSGLPAFSFQSRFQTWWRVCLESFPFSIPTAEQVTSREQARAQTVELDYRTELRVYRETYRVVRASFFSRASDERDERDEAAGTDDPDSSVLGGADAAAANESLRGTVDEIWRNRLERQILGDLDPQAVADIAGALQVPAAAVNTLDRRLRERTAAGNTARIFRRSNSEIRRLRVSHWTPSGHRTSQPMLTASGVLSIATLCRAALPEHSLLWAFAAHLCERELVVPQSPDPWDATRLASELQIWATPECGAAVRKGAADGNRVDRIAVSSFGDDGLPMIPAALRRLSVGPVGAGHDTEALRGLLASCLRSAVPESAAFRWFTRTDLDRWKRALGRDASPAPWIIPAWYLAVVEGLSPRQVVNRLVVDPEERETVEALCGQMQRATESRPMPPQNLPRRPEEATP